MENQKDLLQSKVTWGVIIAIVTQVLQQFGITLDQYLDVGQLTNAIPDAISAILILYGNITRKHTIGSIAGVTISKSE